MVHGHANDVLFAAGSVAAVRLLAARCCVFDARTRLQSEADASNLGLVRFENAITVPELEGLKQPMRSPFADVHCGMSPYETEGYASSMRDDVFNGLFVGALLLNGRSLLAHCQSLKANPTALWTCKAVEFFSSVPSGTPQSVRSILAHILSPASSVESVTDSPDYDAIDMVFSTILVQFN